MAVSVLNKKANYHFGSASQFPNGVHLIEVSHLAMVRHITPLQFAAANLVQYLKSLGYLIT